MHWGETTSFKKVSGVPMECRGETRTAWEVSNNPNEGWGGTGGWWGELRYSLSSGPERRIWGEEESIGSSGPTTSVPKEPNGSPSNRGPPGKLWGGRGPDESSARASEVIKAPTKTHA